MSTDATDARLSLTAEEAARITRTWRERGLDLLAPETTKAISEAEVEQLRGRTAVLQAEDDRPPVDDARVMRIWRECGLPEWFIGRAGTNYRLTEFSRRIRDEPRPPQAPSGWTLPSEPAPPPVDTLGAFLGRRLS